MAIFCFSKIGCFYFFPFISIAHTETDRIETLFFQLLRGSGISGILGIQWKRRIKKAFPKKKERNLFYKSCEFLLKYDNVKSRKNYKKQKFFFKKFCFFRKKTNQNQPASGWPSGGLTSFQFKKLEIFKQKKIFIFYFRKSFSEANFFYEKKQSFRPTLTRKEKKISETEILLFQVNKTPKPQFSKLNILKLNGATHQVINQHKLSQRFSC